MESAQRLIRTSTDSDRAWSEILDRYQPLVYGWLRRHHISHHDAEELMQEVWSVVLKELPTFSHSGNRGAFRCWLRKITANRARGFWRSRRQRAPAGGEPPGAPVIDQLPDRRGGLSERWDTEHRQHVLRECLRRVEPDVAPPTMIAFRRQVFDGQPAEAVAAELGMTVGAAYSAKSRVLRKLREAAGALAAGATWWHSGL